MLPQRADSFDPSAQNPLEVTLARLKVLDPAKYENVKGIAEEALRIAWERTVGGSRG